MPNELSEKLKELATAIRESEASLTKEAEAGSAKVLLAALGLHYIQRKLS